MRLMRRKTKNKPIVWRVYDLDSTDFKPSGRRRAIATFPTRQKANDFIKQTYADNGIDTSHQAPCRPVGFVHID